jgi:type I restriction enzyme S subunit
MKQLFKKLSSVCEIKNGYAFKSNQYKDEGTPLLRISNFDNGDVFMNGKQIFVDSSFLKTKNNFIVEKGDVLIALSGATTGKYGIYNFDYPSLLNQRIGLIKSDQSDKLDSRYFFYYLHVLKVKILQNAGGAAQPNISTNKISEFEIRLPPLKTQQRIAGILDDAAALRDKTAQLLTEYNLLAQSVFLEMFGDPVINEKGWDKEPLKKLGKTITGNTPSRAVSEYYGNYIEWIKTDNINTPNMLLTKADEYLSKLGLTKARKVAKDAILVTCIAGSRRVIGNVSITDRLVSFNQQINAFEAFNGCPLFWYYQFILAKPYVQNNSTNGMKGIITKGKFEKMMFINPPIALQNEFADKIALIEQQKALAKQELQESEDLFNCLLQQAFKGELV